MNDIETKIVKIIAEQSGINESAITKDKYFVNDMGFDSLDLAELILMIENEFDIEILRKDAETFTSVQSAIDYVKNILSK